MDTLDNLFMVLAQANVDSANVDSPEIPVGCLDIHVRHLGVTGKGPEATLHVVGILDELAWGISPPSQAHRKMKLTRPGADTRACLYAHEHFDVFNSRVNVADMCSKLYRPENLHLLTDPENTLNLQVMSILAAHAQNTAYANQFVFNVPVDAATITETCCGWVGLEHIHGLGLRVGGPALAHVLLGINTPASFVDMWVDSPRLPTLVRWLRARFPSLTIGSRIDGTMIVCRPGVGCACRIHPEAHDTPIMKLQPDFAQCIFDGHKVAATPRCLLALKTNKSIHPPYSRHVWASLDAGLRVAGETTPRGKPTVNTSPDTEKKIWNLLTQYGCVDVSAHPDTDARYFEARGPTPPTRWGYAFTPMRMQGFLETPSAEAYALYVYIERMYVESREGDFLHIREPPAVLGALLAHLNASYGTYTPTTEVVILADAAAHAASGVALSHVPVGCSISGIVWWYPGCIRDDGTVYFSITPQVHPGHLAC